MALTQQESLQEALLRLSPAAQDSYRKAVWKETLKQIYQRDQFQWTPQQKQQEAIESPAFEVLFGGSVGGGKSQALLGLARLRHHQSLLLRKSYPRLEESLIKDSLRMYGDRRHYNATLRAWSWDDGCRIRFGYVDTDADVENYKSAEYDFLGVDELTELSEFVYLYLFSRVRTTKPGQRTRVVCATNPGGPGNDFVIRRWGAWLDKDHPKPAQSGEIRWFVRIEDKDTEVKDSHPVMHKGERLYPKSRTFIQSFLSDNVYLDNQEYRATLQILPEPYRSQLLKGDWEIGQVDDAYQVIPKAWVKRAFQNYLGWRRLGSPLNDEHNRPLKMSAVGCDIGRGRDPTVLARRFGNVVTDLMEMNVRDTMSIVSVINRITQSQGGGAIIDINQVGAGVYDRLFEMEETVVGYNGSYKTDERDKSGQLGFANLRSASYWKLREILDPDGQELCALPPDDELMQELTAPTFRINNGKISVEKREWVEKKLHRSPNKADAVVMAFYRDVERDDEDEHEFQSFRKMYVNHPELLRSRRRR